MDNRFDSPGAGTHNVLELTQSQWAITDTQNNRVVVNATGADLNNIAGLTPDANSFAATLGGALPNVAATIKFVKLGNLVILTLPDITGTTTSSNTVFTASATLPAEITPAVTKHGLARVFDATNWSIAPVTINANGSLTFTNGAGGLSFPNTAAIEFAAQEIFYSLV